MKNWFNQLAIILAVMLIMTICCPITVFAHTAKIEITGENRYKAIRLTQQIYNAANSDLSDLLIKDGNGETAPYFFHTGFRITEANKQTYIMDLINSYVMGQSFYFDYRIALTRSSDTLATSIEFTTWNTNFIKEIDVYGSYDNLNWEFVQGDKIYSIDDKAKLFVEFIQPQKYTHYRLRLSNNLEQISFDTVKLAYSVETNEENYFIETIEPAFRVENSDKKTNIFINGLKNLRLCDITIRTDSMFQRNVRTQDGINKELFNLSLNDTTYADTTIPLDWRISQEETYMLTIEDADDKPIEISNISVRYYADEVVFEGNAGGIYTLEFGGNDVKTAPVYDIERYKYEILKGTIDRAEIGAMSYAVEVEAASLPARDYQFIFNIVIIVVALLLGAVILIKLKQT